ncbi:hypothetical protein SADUNF_Sadunf17G0059300 [Salix dunnii]|uniref:CASP-like protein n=1 Tax=Salix dunnii TaxID=1413687 RepID=A0A835MH68_9ROSI|nr:hypothetical protein SADUNF_Sadunf17G0059300 [Salix dunnii]
MKRSTIVPRSPWLELLKEEENAEPSLLLLSGVIMEELLLLLFVESSTDELPDDLEGLSSSMAAPENTTENGFLKAKSPQGMSTPSQPQRMFFMAQITLRVFAIVFTLAAIPIMVTAKEPLSFFGMSIEPSFSQSSAMKFLLGADATVCAFSVLSLLFLWTLRRSESPATNYFFLFLHDMVKVLFF